MKKKFVIKTKYLVTLLTIVCMGLIVLTLLNDSFGKPVRSAVSTVVIPMQKGMNQIGLWFSDRADELKELREIQSENEKLKAEIDQLRMENTILLQQQSELERLRELYKLDDVYSDYDKIAARIIGKETGNWFSVFTINKGSKDGIALNMNVIADGGLVGIVTKVGDNYAQVTTIISDGINVSAKVGSTSDFCIVEGDLKLIDRGVLKVSNIDKNVDVKAGDMLMTSYISDKYVPGILIGYLSEVNDDPNNLTKSGSLIPEVDFAHLEEVLVITTLKDSGGSDNK
ncbi:MAG: rod shape-determining protein MreC [Lachnospiraceae bacterium]|nr:rod shape-determining protein MreC [Lachnospiraceae bacterium]